MKLYFVCTYGRDCDGHSKRSCTGYNNQKVAFTACNAENESSDGTIRSVLSEKQAEEYCEEYNIDFPDYYFNEDMEIVSRKQEEDPEEKFYRGHTTWLERHSDSDNDGQED